MSNTTQLIGFASYPTYKESGVPWLGEIPSHWGITPLKYEISYNDEVLLESTNDEYEIQYIDISSVSLNKGVCKKELISFSDSPSRARRVVKRGDVIVSTVRTYLKAIAQIEEDDNNLIVSTGFAVLRAKIDVIPKFLGYWIQSELMISKIVSCSKGVSYPAINPSDLVRFPLVKLPYLEQQAIVQFLDKQLAYIDTLVNKQKQLIKKLAEQRSAIISHAVTKGLDPNVPMKESGVEWLGKVPEHWEVWKATHLFNNVGSGTTPKSTSPEFYNGNTLWVTTSELREDYIKDTKKKVSSLALETYSTLKIYPKNSVAIAMYGATIGRLGILSKPATFNQACCVFDESTNIYFKFFYYWLWYRRPILISLSNGGGQPNLNQDDLRKLKVPLPTIEEQKEISEYLDQELNKIDQITKSTSKIITKLQEYRSALITQAVTGKIDVRGLVNNDVEIPLNKEYQDE